MSAEEELAQKLQKIEERWKQITASPTPPRSLMNVIEYGLGDKKRGEVYVTRLLRYFLDPSEPHGMDARFLNAFLNGFATEFGFDEPLYDLSNVRVRNEVWIRMETNSTEPVSSDDADDSGDEDPNPSGRVDLVIDKPGEWFMLIELKFSAEENNVAGEGLSQTEFYRSASHIDTTAKTDYENGGYYLYVHERDSDEAADKEEFVNWSWKSIIENVVQPFINTEGSRIPHRTFVQLNELQDDIKEFTDMTSEKPNDEEKVELYLNNYTMLNDLHQAFEDRWAKFTDEWHKKLIPQLDKYIHTNDEIDDGIMAAELNNGDKWYFRAKHKDWQHLFKHGWWKPADKELWNQGDLEGIHQKASGNDTLRISYIHRTDANRDVAIEDNTLIVTFRNAGANPKPFYDEFSDLVDSRKQDILDTLPDSAEWLGNKENQFEIRYDIPKPDPDTESAPDDFFEAYTVTLGTAFIELVIENQKVTNILTEIYDDAVDKHMSCL